MILWKLANPYRFRAQNVKYNFLVKSKILLVKGNIYFTN